MVIYRLGLPYYKEFDNFKFIELFIKYDPLTFLSMKKADGFFCVY